MLELDDIKAGIKELRETIMLIGDSL